MKKYLVYNNIVYGSMGFVPTDKKLRQETIRILPKGIYFLMGRVTVNQELFYKVSNNVHVYYLTEYHYITLKQNKCSAFEAMTFKHLLRKKLL